MDRSAIGHRQVSDGTTIVTTYIKAGTNRQGRIGVRDQEGADSRVLISHEDAARGGNIAAVSDGQIAGATIAYGEAIAAVIKSRVGIRNQDGTVTATIDPDIEGAGEIAAIGYRQAAVTVQANIQSGNVQGRISAGQQNGAVTGAIFTGINR